MQGHWNAQAIGEYANKVHYSDVRACPLKDENLNGLCHKGFIAGHMALITNSFLRLVKPTFPIESKNISKGMPL